MAKSNADKITEKYWGKTMNVKKKNENHLKTDQNLFRENVVDMKAGVFMSHINFETET